jgi:hypothetical protein
MQHLEKYFFVGLLQDNGVISTMIDSPAFFSQTHLLFLHVDELGAFIQISTRTFLDLSLLKLSGRMLMVCKDDDKPSASPQLSQASSNQPGLPYIGPLG